MAGLFQNKVALVTGASSGIGRASAKAFAREGAKVVVSDINIAGANETVEMIQKAGGEAFFVKCDVANIHEVEALIQTSVKTYGRLDFAHNNAGIAGDVASTADCSKENWHRVIDINLNGVWYCMKYVIPEILKIGKGAIVNTSSISGLHGVRNQGVYSATKHAVIGLTKSAALEYAKTGIRINALCPGWTSTIAPTREEVHDTDPGYIHQYAVGRAGTPEEQAEATIWLCSDAASFVNGITLIVDGGRMAL
jgi:NAD(P)-dependent dehydrogenase (short-subunit alcohol dehydrogenase family)